MLLHPDLEIDIDAPITKIEEQISAVGGKVIKRDNWGKKRLAYPVKGHQFAVYVAYVLQLENDKVITVDRSLRLREEVIRYLLVKTPEISPNAKPVKKRTEAKEVKEEEKEAVNG